MKSNVTEIIQALGGQAEVARLCEITRQSVQGWDKKGRIPKPWRKFLALLRPDLAW